MLHIPETISAITVFRIVLIVVWDSVLDLILLLLGSFWGDVSGLGFDLEGNGPFFLGLGLGLVEQLHEDVSDGLVVGGGAVLVGWFVEGLGDGHPVDVVRGGCFFFCWLLVVGELVEQFEVYVFEDVGDCDVGRTAIVFAAVLVDPVDQTVFCL